MTTITASGKQFLTGPMHRLFKSKPLLKNRPIQSLSKVYAYTLLFLLSACASMPISSMWKLRNVDILTTNPQEIRIAIITNSLVQLADGSTSMAISFSSPSQEHNFSYRLKPIIKQNASSPELNSKIGRHEALTIFYLSQEDANSLKLAQSRILAIRDQNIEGDGSLSINIETGCFKQPPPKSLFANIFTQFDRKQGYVHMQRNLDLMQIREKGDQSLWQSCDAKVS